MTELAGCLSVTSIWDRIVGSIGGVLPCAKMQLRDVPELGFKTDAEPPVGEIHIMGNSAFLGYFKNPRLTADTIDEEGWVKTGDIGILNKNGSIRIIDRVNEFAKL